MALLQFILTVLALETCLRIQVRSDESFLAKYPLSFLEEEVVAEKAYPFEGRDGGVKQSETRRRSTLDKNFVRLGRGGGHLAPLYFEDDEFDDDPFERPTRSGEKSDQFIRFGRGKSDFVRFGRRPKSDFVRFGRSKNVEERKKRDIAERKRQGSNNSDFVRFGRNENFMRFGRLERDDKNRAKNATLKHNYLTAMLLKLMRQRKQLV